MSNNNISTIVKTIAAVLLLIVLLIMAVAEIASGRVSAAPEFPFIELDSTTATCTFLSVIIAHDKHSFDLQGLRAGKTGDDLAPCQQIPSAVLPEPKPTAEPGVCAPGEQWDKDDQECEPKEDDNETETPADCEDDEYWEPKTGECEDIGSEPDVLLDDADD